MYQRFFLLATCCLYFILNADAFVIPQPAMLRQHQVYRLPYTEVSTLQDHGRKVTNPLTTTTTTTTNSPTALLACRRNLKREKRQMNYRTRMREKQRNVGKLTRTEAKNMSLKQRQELREQEWVLKSFYPQTLPTDTPEELEELLRNTPG